MKNFNPFAIVLGGIPILMGIYMFTLNPGQLDPYIWIIGGALVWWWFEK